MTLRQALHSLEKEGLVVVLPGSGTFLGPLPIANKGLGPRSLVDEFDAQGVELSTVVLSRRIRALPAAVAGQLNRTPGEHGLRLERLRMVRGLALLYQVS